MRRVTLMLVLICAAAQALECGPCNCYTGDGDAGGRIWKSSKTSECATSNTFTSVPDTSVLPADTQVLYLNDQNIPTIKENQFITFKKLQMIIMHYCQISVVESHAFRNMTNVTVISLHVNLISTLPTGLFTDTPNIKLIILSYNKFQVLQENLFLNLKQLEGVQVQGNEIIFIKENSFVNVPSLYYLHLKNNKLSNLSLNIICELPNLEYLNLHSNPWHCDRMLCEVMSAYVHSHLWDTVSDEPTCASPSEVAGKQWKDAVVTMCKSTSALQPSEVAGKQWKDAVVTMCKSTSALQPGQRYCGTCRCTDDPVTVTCAAPYRPWIAHTMRAGVVKLNITGQNMPTVTIKDFLNFKNLQILNLENNNIRIIELNAFDPVKGITTISLGHNKITDVRKTIFSNLMNLKEIDLSHNELIYIEGHCFANLPSLEAVDLSNNRLQTLQFNIFADVSKLSLLALHDNPWKCDLSLCSVMNAVVSRELWAADKEPMCSSPRHVHKKPWTGIYLQFQPSISSSVTSVTEGDNVTLHCNYCFVSRVRWTFNGKELHKHQLTVSNGTAKLTLKSIGRNGEGYYKCEVKNCDYCDYDEVLLNVTPRESINVEQVIHIPAKVNNSTNAKRGLLLLHYTFLPTTKLGNSTQSQSETISQESVLKKIMNVK